MSNSQAHRASHQNHLAALRHKHAMLEERLNEERKHPSVGSLELAKLQKKKLALKDEILREENGDG